VYELDEEEHSEYIYLKAMSKKLKEIERIDGYTFRACNMCSCPWARHKLTEYESNLGLGHYWCNVCGERCYSDLNTNEN
jgi:hypothetical protein